MKRNPEKNEIKNFNNFTNYVENGTYYASTTTSIYITV